MSDTCPSKSAHALVSAMDRLSGFVIASVMSRAPTAVGPDLAPFAPPLAARVAAVPWARFVADMLVQEGLHTRFGPRRRKSEPVFEGLARAPASARRASHRSDEAEPESALHRGVLLLGAADLVEEPVDALDRVLLT